MKKIFSLIFVLAIFSLLLQVLKFQFTNQHMEEYSLKTSTNSYEIKENFKHIHKYNLYYFKIIDQDSNIYSFSYNYNFHKRDRIIKDIIHFESDDLNCIFPVYIRKKSGDIICNLNGENVSYSYLKQKGNRDVEKFVNQLQKAGYNYSSWENVNDNSSKIDSVEVYQKNIPENKFLTMWFYKGFYIFTNENLYKKELLVKDKYDNETSFVVDRFYVTVNTDQSRPVSYSSFIVYDIINGGKSIIDLDDSISNNSYFNGVYKGELYITDLNKKMQYALNPDRETFRIVGSMDLGFKTLANDHLIDINNAMFLSNKFYFNNETSNKMIIKKYNTNDIKIDQGVYFFKDDKGNFYKAYENDLDNPTLLFSFDKVSEWIEKDLTLMVITNDMVYLYDDQYGLRPVIKNSELLYNYKNICDFVEK